MAFKSRFAIQQMAALQVFVFVFAVTSVYLVRHVNRRREIIFRTRGTHKSTKRRWDVTFLRASFSMAEILLDIVFGLEFSIRRSCAYGSLPVLVPYSVSVSARLQLGFIWVHDCILSLVISSRFHSRVGDRMHQSMWQTNCIDA
jgi:hypothetical protein